MVAGLDLDPGWAIVTQQCLRGALSCELAARALRNCALIEAVGSDDGLYRLMLAGTRRCNIGE